MKTATTFENGLEYPVEAVTASPSYLELSLTVTDDDSVRELTAVKEGRQRDEYSLGALRVGLLSLRHARGQVDADAVKREGDRILTEMNGAMETFRDRLNTEVANVLKEYFDPNSGRFQDRVNRLICKDGELERILAQHVGNNGSKLAETLAAHVGESSPIMALLDPEKSDGVVQSIRDSAEQVFGTEVGRVLAEFSLDNKESALSRMVAELENQNGGLTKLLSDKIEVAMGEFSLDKEDSALSRLVGRVERAQKTISSEFSMDNEQSALARLRGEILRVLKEQNDQNVVFQREVQGALEAMKARRAESMRSPAHGNDFEAAVNDFVRRETERCGDIFEATGSRVGKIKNCKVGDAVVELGPESGAPGVCYVIEAKEKAAYTLGKAREEIEEARKNRGASVGLFVFSKLTAPDLTDSVVRIGNDVFVVWDAEDISSDIILKVALSLTKSLCIRENKVRQAEAAEFESIDKAILAIEKEAKRLNELRRMAESIRSNSESILDEVRRMIDGLNKQVGNLREAVEGLGDVSQSSMADRELALTS